MFLYVSISYPFVTLITAFVYMPVFKRVNSLSAFAYVTKRFGNSLSLLACVTYIIQMVIYMGIVLYSPALALNAVTGMSLEFSIVVISAVCLFYTVIGGMKAVIYTDALQAFVMIIGMTLVATVGTVNVGGLSAVYETNKLGRHLDMTRLSLDPRVRHSGLDLVLGGTVIGLAVHATNQAQVQTSCSFS